MPNKTTPPKTNAEVIAAIQKYSHAKVGHDGAEFTVVAVDRSCGELSLYTLLHARVKEHAEHCTILLHPLSSITDEHAIWVYELIIGKPIGGDRYNVTKNKTEINIESIYNVDHDDKTNVFIPYSMDIYYTEDGSVNEVNGERMLEIIDYLRSKCYDLDGYIESGIAKPITSN